MNCPGNSAKCCILFFAKAYFGYHFAPAMHKFAPLRCQHQCQQQKSRPSSTASLQYHATSLVSYSMTSRTLIAPKWFGIAFNHLFMRHASWLLILSQPNTVANLEIQLLSFHQDHVDAAKIRFVLWMPEVFATLGTLSQHFDLLRCSAQCRCWLAAWL